jgi:excisionase family DNA binding protein
MPYRTFGVEEVARYLHLERDDVERLVHERDIPFERHGDRLVFRKVEIDSWASPRILKTEGRQLAEYHAKTSRQVRPLVQGEAVVSDLVQPASINAALSAKTRASVLREMVELAERTGSLLDKEALLEGLEQREKLCSTGLPGGLAILHSRQPEPYVVGASFIVLGRTQQQIPFGAPDGQPTDLFFLVACEDERLHLHALARLCMMVQKTELLAGLRAAADASSMHDVLVASEQAVLEGLARH